MCHPLTIGTLTIEGVGYLLASKQGSVLTKFATLHQDYFPVLQALNSERLGYCKHSKGRKT